MREPPELHEPFRSEDERAEHIAALLELDRELESLRTAASLSGAELMSSPAWKHLSKVRPGTGDSVELRLRRYLGIFEKDLAAIRQARNRVVHSTWISDEDLRAAVWLGNEVLKLITGETRESRTA